MTTAIKKISKKRIYRIKCQGFSGYRDEEVSQHAFGNRFPIMLCAAILAVGVALASIPILLVLMLISLFSVILPYHPFDYVYNYWLRKVIGRPKLPPRSMQLKFACTIAVVWIGVHIILFSQGYMIAGYISGGLMFCVPFLVSTIDFCIPSMIYNFIFRVKIV